MDLKEKILVALGLNEEEVKLGWQGKSEDGTTILLPIGTYKTDDGLSFRVEDEGVVAELIESETEEKEEASEEVKAEEEADVADWKGMEKRIENLEIAVAKLKEAKEGGDDESEEMSEEVTEPSINPKSIKTTEVKEFSAEEELEKLKAENEKLKTELAEQPADAPINTNKFSSERAAPTKKELKRMTKQEKYLYNLYK